MRIAEIKLIGKSRGLSDCDGISCTFVCAHQTRIDPPHEDIIQLPTTSGVVALESLSKEKPSRQIKELNNNSSDNNCNNTNSCYKKGSLLQKKKEWREQKRKRKRTLFQQGNVLELAHVCLRATESLEFNPPICSFSSHTPRHKYLTTRSSQVIYCMFIKYYIAISDTTFLYCIIFARFAVLEQSSRTKTYLKYERYKFINVCSLCVLTSIK